MSVMDATLERTSDIDVDDWSERPFTVEPQLFVCFGPDADAPPSRHRLGDVQQVFIGRGETTTWSREVIDGRPTLDLQIGDPRISSRQCVMTRRRAGWTVKDDGSKNGTKVDGYRLADCALTDGAVITIGRTVLLFRSAVPVDPRGAHDLASDRLPAEDPDWATFHDPLARAYRKLAGVAVSTVPVLVTGETGTGKEVVAQVLHRLSGRPGSCVAVNCAAVPESLAEAEFFGHRKGAFTGADTDRVGWIRSAQNGTLFLDEIGDLRPPVQAVILRAIESKSVLPVGASRPIAVDFRLVSATNIDLDNAIAEGGFRMDMRSRLGRWTLDLPALVDRREDIALLVPRLLRRLCGSARVLHPDAAERLLLARWRGNVRDLVSVLEIAAAQAGDRRIEARHLPELERLERPPPQPYNQIPLGLTEDQLTQRAELIEALKRAKGNVAQVSRELGIHRQQLHRFFRRYGIDPDDFR